MDSDIPAPYFTGDINVYTKPSLPITQVNSSKFWREKVNFEKKKGGEDIGLAAFIASNCESQERTEYVNELMNYIKIDSYGKCLNNKVIY